MKVANRKSGFTLVEVLIVVVIMAVLAATIIPQFSDSTKDAKISSAQFNLHTLRAQVELYKSQHDGVLPGTALAELTSKTNNKGTVGTSATFPYGPYLRELPANPFTNSKTVKTITGTAPVAGDVTATDGWLYNSTTGGIWMNEASHLTD